MRIVTQEELDAVKPHLRLPDMLSYTTARYCAACETHARSICNAQCVLADGEDWFWHGIEGEHPTPESIHQLDPFNCTNRRYWTCSNGHDWFGCEGGCDEYLRRVHARAATLAAAINGDYDEDAERARLVAVPA